MDHHECMNQLGLYITGNLDQISDLEIIYDHIVSCDECRNIFIDIKSYEDLVQRYFELFSSKSPGLQAMIASIDGLMVKGFKGNNFVDVFEKDLDKKAKKSLSESKDFYKRCNIAQATERLKEALELRPKDKDVSKWSTFLNRIFPRILDEEIKRSLSKPSIKNLLNAYEITMSVEIKDNAEKPRKDIVEIMVKKENGFFRQMNRKISLGKDLQEKQKILNQWAREVVIKIKKSVEKEDLSLNSTK